MDPLTACDAAAAAYHVALPAIVGEAEGGSDYLQIRASMSTTMVSIAGTNDDADWDSNRRCELTPWLAGRVHRGFLDGWNYLRGKTRRELQAFAGDEICVNGHSRGGGIGQLAAWEINQWDEHRGRVRLLTLFASPRAGDAAFCRALEQSCQIIRYETSMLPLPWFRDPIPHLPLRKMGYCHAGKPTHLFAIGTPWRLHDLDTYRAAIKRRGSHRTRHRTK